MNNVKDAVDAALKLSREIMKIEEQEKRLRARKEEKKAALARLLSGGAGPPAAAERTSSLRARVHDLVIERFPSTITVDEISSATGAEEGTIRTILSRLKTSGEVETPSRGEYRARRQPEKKEEIDW